jgi:hypothetical protein
MIVVSWLISAAWLREVRYPHSAPIEAQAALGQLRSIMSKLL